MSLLQCNGEKMFVEYRSWWSSTQLARAGKGSSLQSSKMQWQCQDKFWHCLWMQPMQGDLFLLDFYVASVPFVPSSRIQLNLILPWFGSKCVKRSHRSEFPQSTYLPCQQERTRYPPHQRDLQMESDLDGVHWHFSSLERPPHLDAFQCHSSRGTSRSWWSPASASDPASCPVICLPSVSLPSCLPHRLSLLPSL